jgi:hypothetical protein
VEDYEVVMMLFGVQILILLFGLVMIYFTFLYYKRANYDKMGLIVWFLVWLGFIFLGVFPQTVYGVMQLLAIERTADFFYAGGMLFFAVLMFYLYNITKKSQKQLETLVREIAFKRAETKEKKRK